MDNQNKTPMETTKSVDETVKTYITYVKIALAVVIIRSKRAHQSAEEFTRELICHYHSNQTDWKKKCDALQEQVVHLQQELTLSRLGYADSVRDTDSGQNQSGYPTPPSSLELVPGPFSAFDSMQKTSLFLQAVGDLRTTPDDAMVLFQSVRNVLEFCCDSLLRKRTPLPKVAEHCLRQLTDLSQKELLTDDILRLIDGFVEDALHCIMESRTSNKHEYCQNIIDSLALLSPSDSLFDLISSRVVMQIELCASTLHAHSREPAAFDQPDFFENCFYLFRCLETVLPERNGLCVIAPIPPGKRELNVVFASKWKKIAEISFLHLNEHFPLFVQYVWRIGALLVDTSTQLI